MERESPRWGVGSAKGDAQHHTSGISATRAGYLESVWVDARVSTF